MSGPSKAPLVIAAMLSSIALAVAEDNKPRVIETKPRQIIERPFGTPPNRAPELGTRCVAATVTCEIEPRHVGDKCSCLAENGQNAQGLVVD
jgi:hypothetical protein